MQRNLGSDSLQRWLDRGGLGGGPVRRPGGIPGTAGDQGGDDDDAATGRRQLGSTDVKRLNRSWRRRTQARIGLLLDVGRASRSTSGSIIRTAAAFGVDQLWLCGDSATPEHPSARKTALGTDRYLPWEQLPDGRRRGGRGPGGRACG